MKNATKEPQSETIGRQLVAVRFEGLFGNLTHAFALNTASGVTILTGANGCGKTTIINLIEAFANNDLRVLLDVPFRELVFQFNDNTEIIVIRREGADMLEGREPEAPLFVVGKPSWSGVKRKKPVREMVFKNACELEFALRDSTGSEIDEPYITAVFTPGIDKDKNYFECVLRHEEQYIPCWLEEFLKQFAVRFISTDRLEEQKLYLKEQNFRADDPEENYHRELAIEQFSRLFMGRVANARALMAKKTEELDIDSVFRLKARTNVDCSYSVNDLKARIENITDKRQRLVDLGLLTMDDKEIFVIDDDMVKRNGALLLDDVESEEQKFATVDKLLQETELFQKIINSRLINKKIALNDSKGFEIINSYNGERIPLHKLSSGEQQEIVLFFKLIFLMQPGCLVIIDEPELSLHIAWQMNFINDLEKVRRLNDCQFIVSTHSPAIIDDHWDYVVELEV